MSLKKWPPCIMRPAPMTPPVTMPISSQRRRQTGPQLRPRPISAKPAAAWLLTKLLWFWGRAPQMDLGRARCPQFHHLDWPRPAATFLKNPSISKPGPSRRQPRLVPPHGARGLRTEPLCRFAPLAQPRCDQAVKAQNKASPSTRARPIQGVQLYSHKTTGSWRCRKPWAEV